jgi:hypothetical protein
MGTGINKITAEINNKFITPKLFTNNIGIDGPIIAPILAPEAIKPNNLGACSLENKLETKLQKTET